MRKKLHLPSLSIGSEPDTPSISDLKEFISTHKGIEADLISIKMVRSFSAQKEAHIDKTAVGGSYLRPRMEEVLSWGPEQGPLVHSDLIISDYNLITRQGAEITSVHESPGLLSTSPDSDDEDSFAEICHGFRQVLRNLRDNYVSGHIIHLEHPASLELELLSGSKTLFYLNDPMIQDLGELLEYTHDLILPADRVIFLHDLMDQYQIRTIALCDATIKTLQDAMQYIDPDHLKVAGYCMGSEKEYWKKIKDSAIISV